MSSPRNVAPATAPTFLLGTGCQKGGTTWLYRHLKRSPAFVAGYRKEYHVFDTLDVPAQEYMRARVFDLAEQAVADARRGDPVDGDVLHRLSMYADPEIYYGYFTGLLAATPGARLTADMTPENGLLPTSRLRSIRAAFAERGVRTATVFVMRDPVDRIWSQVRMQHHRTPDRFTESPEDTLRRVHRVESFASRTAYDRVVERIDAAFPAQDVTYSFYERLFEHTELERICRNLGIDPPEPELDRRANASPGRDVELPEATVRLVAEHYRDVYRFVQDRFPVDLAELWPSSRFVL